MSSSPLRVALGPVNPAGTTGALAAGLRAIGVDAELVVWLAFAHRRNPGRLVGRVGRVAYAAGLPMRRDVINYQGFSWLPRLADVRWARTWGRTLVATFHGDDCRLYGVARRLFPERARTGDPAGDPVVEARVARLGSLCQAAIVPDLELATYVLLHFDRVYVIPPALEDEPDEPAIAAEPSRRPIALHAPSVRSFKGTELIEAAVAALGRRRPLDFRLVSGASHASVAAEIARADVVIDQLNSVNVGVFALEAMRAGKPVLSQLGAEGLAPYQYDLPVIGVTAETLEGELETLLLDPDRRAELGERGRAYVARHAPVAVARATLAGYEHARTGAKGLFAAVDGETRRLDREERRIRERLASVAAGAPAGDSDAPERVAEESPVGPR